MAHSSVVIHGGLVIRTMTRAGAMLVWLEGELDISSRAALRRLLRSLDLETTRLLDVDLAKVTFCDIGGYQALVVVAQIARAVGLNVRMHSAPALLRRVAQLDAPGTPPLLE